MHSYNIYCFSYNNEERKKRMNTRFNSIGKIINWIGPVDIDDPRVKASTQEKRATAVMYNHLDMLKAFIESDEEFGVFCEDDIYIRKDFNKCIQIAFDAYTRLDLTLLLVGYLLNYNPIEFKNLYPNYHQELEPTFSFLSYYNELWGAQMYILNKNGAKSILERFYDHTTHDPFTSDWTITKFGKNAIMYPMLAIEEGGVNTTNSGQITFHKECLNINYNEKLHI